MMRTITALLLFAVLCVGADAKARLRARMPDCMPYDEFHQHFDKLFKHPPFITPARLPPGSHIGRCLLQVDGKTLISGTCIYSIAKDGSFGIEGPRSTYPGYDYPFCFGSTAMTSTTDRWAAVQWVSAGEKLDDGSPGPGWNAGYDGGFGSNHLEGFIGPVNRHGACFVSKLANAKGQRARICLWRR